MRQIFLALFLALTALVARAETVKMPVHVETTAEDTIGRQLAYQLRESIRSSGGLELVDTKDDAIIRIKIVTLDPDTNGSGYRTIYSLVWTIKQLDSGADIFWNNSVGICGQSRVSSCASDMAARTDEISIQMKEIIRKLISEKK